MKNIKLIILFYLFSIVHVFSFTAGGSNSSFSPKSAKSIQSKQALLATPELWSNPNTWGGTKPVAGDLVNIPADKYIILDESPPALGGLTIDGKLEFAAKDLNLTTRWIMIMGQMHIGSETAPFQQKAIITLTGTDMNESVMGMGTRGLMVMGGLLELHGTPPTKTWTKINANALKGSTNLTLLAGANWKVNDQIVVAPTDYIGTGDAQRVSINAINGNAVTISTGLNAQRWGVLQYATSSGMSLTPGTIPSTVVDGTPTILDERAEVGNLTRNIVIQSPDDALWQNDKFGCHVMVMRNGNTQGVAHIDGIEIKRGGQNGQLGRYPFHWHMLSYAGINTLADATGQYFKNSSVNESVNRGIVIHGTNGVLVQNNVLFDIKGHGIFTEDASERRNTIDGNLVLHVRDPLTPLKLHESNSSGGGASGFWISNPDNIITNNTVAGSGFFGYWLAFTTQAWGQSEGIKINPSRLLFGVFDNNTAHSNEGDGVHIDNVEADILGNLKGMKYVSTTDGLDPESPFPNRRRHMLSRYCVWKNAASGIWNRAFIPDNDQAISADNCFQFFSGAGDDGLLKRCLLVGTSLNYNMNGVTIPSSRAGEPPVGFSTYHSTFDIKDNLVINFPAVANIQSGAFGTAEYYLVPVDKGLVRNVNNTLIKSHPGVKVKPGEPQFTLGTLWDPYDIWGGSPTEDNYYVFDTPFFTYGQTPKIVLPNTATSGGVIVEGPFYGVSGFVVNKTNGWGTLFLAQINVNRLNSSLGNVGSMSVGEGAEGQKLANMRHFSTHPTGLYDLNFPTLTNINDLIFSVSNMLTANDYQVLAVEYNGNYKIDGVFASLRNYITDFAPNELPVADMYTHVYAPVSSLNQVINSTNGEVYWQDRVNNKVWMKVRGGVNPGNPDVSEIKDANLYKSFNIRLYGSESPLSISSDNLETKTSGLKVYPNPTSGAEVLLEWNTSNNANNAISITNSLGKIMFKDQSSQLIGDAHLKVNVSNWSNGIYFVTIGNETVKFIKNGSF